MSTQTVWRCMVALAVICILLIFGDVTVASSLLTDPTPQPDTSPPYPPRNPDDQIGDISISAITSATAEELAIAMGIPDSDVVSASLGGSDPAGVGIGDSSLSHFPTAGSTYAVLSTGLAKSADTANTSGSLSYQLAGLNNEQGNDLVQLTLNLTVPSDKNCMSVDFGFYSEEVPEYVGSIYNDAFTAELGLTDLRIVNSELIAPYNFAFDTKGNVISVNTVTGVSTETGTTYDGGTQLLQARELVIPNTTIKIVFSVQDLGDSVWDSAAFLDNFQWLNVPPSLCQVGASTKPPLVLVHGWQGITPTSLTCDIDNIQQDQNQQNLEILHLSDLGKVSQTNPSPIGAIEAMQYWAGIPEWLKQDYDVWIAQLKTGLVQGTPSLTQNGQCLRNQINYVYNTINAGSLGSKQKITIVAHSMGGLVSRACLTYEDCSNKVDKLVTLGSPHSGLFLADLLSAYPSNCIHFTGGCDMSISKMIGDDGFNALHPNKRNIEYYFLGGWHHVLLRPDDDGLVRKYSSIGWNWPGKEFDPPWWDDASPPKQFWTDEWHSKAYSVPDGVQTKNDYMRYRLENEQLTNERSHAYQCFDKWLGGESIPSICENASIASQSINAQDIINIQNTQYIKGSLYNGQSVLLPLQIDTTGLSAINLRWTNGLLNFTLIRPDGLEIDPLYATAHPDEVAYNLYSGGVDLLPHATYSFSSTVPGLWQLNITAENVATDGVKFLAYADLETNRILTAASDQDHYSVGQTATFTATLQNGNVGIPGAIVTAKFTRSDGVIDNLSMVDQGNGNYAGTYVIPDAPGFLQVEVVSTGVDDGISFTRQVDLLPTIGSNDVNLTGTYVIQPQNNNGDNLYETLNILVDVAANSSGDYTIFVNLTANGQMVTQSAFNINLAVGTQTIALPLNGNEIRNSQIDGPYTVSKIVLVPSNLGIIAKMYENVVTTSILDWNEFGGCYSLNVDTNPTDGGIIVADPLPNCNAGTQYSVGTDVQLTAEPASGLDFMNWIVDASGAENPINVKITEDKFIAANFVEGSFAQDMPIYLPLILKNSSDLPTGFNSQFNNSAAGWIPQSGVWSPTTYYYYTAGIPNAWATTSHGTDFSNFDYQVKLWRSGCDYCSNSIFVRGSPSPLRSDYMWDDFYLFQYDRYGEYSIWKGTNGGTPVALQAWTYSSAINTYDNWNTLRVIANGSSLYFYINNMLLWAGSDSTLSSGRVGIGMYSDGTYNDGLYADWATLSTLSTTSLETLGLEESVSSEQQALNDEAKQNQTGDENISQSQPQD